jgi:hypothetical protein
MTGHRRCNISKFLCILSVDIQLLQKSGFLKCKHEKLPLEHLNLARCYGITDDTHRIQLFRRTTGAQMGQDVAWIFVSWYLFHVCSKPS